VRLAALNLKDLSGWIQGSQGQNGDSGILRFSLNLYVLTFCIDVTFLCKFVYLGCVSCVS